MANSTLEKARKFVAGIVNRKKEIQKTSWQEYDRLVEALLDGEEVDSDYIQAVMEAVGKSEIELTGDPEFERRGLIIESNGDLELKVMRRRWASELAELKAVQAKIPKLESAFEAAKRKLEETTKPLQEAVSQAYRELSEAHNKTIAISSFESHLQQTVTNPEILTREQEINDRRKKLHERELEINEMYRREFSAYDFEVRRLEELTGKPVADAEKSPDVARQQKAEIDALKRSIEYQRPSVEEARRELDAIKKEQSQLARELTELNRQKLIP